MKNRLAVVTLLAAVALPTLSYADEPRWESLRVYALPNGDKVAVAVPSEWEALDQSQTLGNRPLRFRDAAGAELAIPTAALARASQEKRVFRPDLTQKVARNAR